MRTEHEIHQLGLAVSRMQMDKPYAGGTGGNPFGCPTLYATPYFKGFVAALRWVLDGKHYDRDEAAMEIALERSRRFEKAIEEQKTHDQEVFIVEGEIK